MDHFHEVYSRSAAAYHQMISAEDVDHQLLEALQQSAPIARRRVLDLGTGTGRLPLLLAPEGAQTVGLDLHADMLRENARQRGRVGGRWELVRGDMRALPFPQASADVVTAGWAIGHLRGWHAAEWQAQIGQVLNEMHRVVRPGGALIILETLTTGSLEPAPPTPALAEYYAWLEQRWGFGQKTIQTDYAFASVEEAVARTEFFFGAELAARIRAQRWARVPEWTGVWSKRV